MEGKPTDPYRMEIAPGDPHEQRCDIAPGDPNGIISDAPPIPYNAESIPPGPNYFDEQDRKSDPWPPGEKDVNYNKTENVPPGPMCSDVPPDPWILLDIAPPIGFNITTEIIPPGPMKAA